MLTFSWLAPFYEPMVSGSSFRVQRFRVVPFRILVRRCFGRFFLRILKF
jgi:hypothetical protein